MSNRVDATIERALAHQRLVGVVVLIAQDGEVLYQRAGGFADREAQLPMRENTVFRLSSLTKPIVSAAAIALVERKLLDLNDTAVRWLPQFRPKTPLGGEATITLRQLLTHTAALTYGFFEPDNGPYHRAGVSDGLAEAGLSIQEELTRLASVPLVYAPGTAWGYSLGLDVLGEIMSRATRASLPALVEELVTIPLGMSDTGFAPRDLQRLATPYVDGSPPRRMKDPDIVAFAPGSGIRFSPSRILDHRSFTSAGTGMVGTAIDFLSFLETLRAGGGAILTADSVREMMSNQIGALRISVEATPSWGFGFGGAVLMDPAMAQVPQGIGTWKWGGVYGHHWYVDSQNGLTLVALSNTAIEGMLGEFVTELTESVYGKTMRTSAH
ncbi:MAG TPA: serine hydrolase domain-containing protein [Steroidobacteraceae bacterium]